MPKLHQVVAIDKDTKNRAKQAVDEIDKAFQRPSLFEGFVKLYQRKDENDEDVPAQRQTVQVKVLEAQKSVAPWSSGKTTGRRDQWRP